MKNKISVKEYLNNEEKLIVKKYIPYERKVLIVDSILKQVCANINGFYKLDSVLLDRIKDQIIIEQTTNLDLKIVEDGLDGYDLLLMNDRLDSLIEIINKEYLQFDKILSLRISDYLKFKSSVSGFLHYKTEYILDWMENKSIDIINKLNDIDVERLVRTFSNTLDGIIKKNK